MKILIVATPRSGSSELASRIKRYLQLKHIFFEPFNYEGDHPMYNFEDDAVVKCIVDQVPEGEDRNNPIPFYREYVKNFDRVIMLRRENLVQQIESYNWYFYRRKNGLPVNEPYEYVWQPGYEGHRDYILLCDEWLKRLSGITNIPYVAYENIFRIDGEKYRQNVKKVTI